MRGVIFFNYCFFALFFLFPMRSGVFAQMHVQGDLYVADFGVMYLDTGTLSFSAVGGSGTSRSLVDYGVLSLGSSVDVLGASSGHYVDGYVRVSRASSVVLPLGQGGVYAPLRLLPTSLSAIDAAYWSSDPNTVGSVLDGSVNSLSSYGFWELNSNVNSTLVSLSWQAISDVTTLTGSDLSQLIIAGWDGSKWVQIASSVDAISLTVDSSTSPISSSLQEGSITTVLPVDLSRYRYFTLASKGDCSPLVDSSGIVKTWDGVSWTPSHPTIYDPVIINGPYTGDLSCNSLVLNADVTLENGNYLELVNEASGTGRLLMSSQASFVQRNSNATAPTIELTKRTRALKAFDYVYWGTPIVGNFFSQLSGAKALTGSASGAFDLKYKYVSGPGGGWQNLTSITTGKGFIMRVKPVAPFVSNQTDQINLKLTGVANNGTITVPIAYNSASPNGATSHNLLANPYPSAIDGDMFLRLNTSIDGVLYVWQQSTPPGNSLQTSYTQADYLAYTRAGFVSPSSMGSFDGKIASGQGFKVKALSNGSVFFNNCMRLTGSNTSFYRETPFVVNSGNPIDRFKVTLTKDDGSVFSQILISYLEECTEGYDRMYDAGRNSVSTTQLFSLLPSDNRRLAINARPSFTLTDSVPIGFSKTTTAPEVFTLSVSQKEGLFQTGGVSIYLHDKQLDTFHDLTVPFNLTLSTTLLDTRYEIVYQDNSLVTPEYGGVLSQAYIKGQVLYISATESLKEVLVYDVTGKLIKSFGVADKTSCKESFPFAEGVYLLKVRLSSDKWVSHKLITIR